MPISADHTLMFREAAEAGAAVRRQRAANADAIAALGARLRDQRPRAVVTLARGSSDCAATFARYLIERHAGVLTSSATPSIASVYRATPDLTGCVMLAISQSGRSPDLLEAAEQARNRGATIVALVNDEQAPLGKLADVCLPLAAGPERSVAATKSFVASLAAVLDLLAAWTRDGALDDALAALPDRLDDAWQCDWTPALAPLREARDMYVLGRGHGFGVAQEAALKLKEVCGLHAEAFSTAEVRHGPMALVGTGFPLLLFAQPDETREGIAELGDELAARGALVLRAGAEGKDGIALPTVEADAFTAPVVQIASFYRFANALAVARGRDPDKPPHLVKVTETV